MTIGLVSLPSWSIDKDACVVWPRPIGSRTHPAVPFGPTSPALVPRNLEVNANEAVRKPKSLKLLQQDADLQQQLTGTQLEFQSWAVSRNNNLLSLRLEGKEYLRIMRTCANSWGIHRLGWLESDSNCFWRSVSLCFFGCEHPNEPAVAVVCKRWTKHFKSSCAASSPIRPKAHACPAIAAKKLQGVHFAVLPTKILVQICRC